MRRIMGEEEIEGCKHVFEGALERHDELRRGWFVAKAFRRGVGLDAWRDRSGVEGREGKVEEQTRVGQEIDRLVGKGFWELVTPQAEPNSKPQANLRVRRTWHSGTDKEEGRGMLSKEGAIMTVLRAVVEWKKFKGQEELRTPWEVLMESVRVGKYVQTVRNEVLNAMRVSTGEETLEIHEEDGVGDEKVGDVREDERTLLSLGSDGLPLQQEEKSALQKSLSGSNQDVDTIDKNAEASNQPPEDVSSVQGTFRPKFESAGQKVWTFTTADSKGIEPESVPPKGKPLLKQIRLHNEYALYKFARAEPTPVPCTKDIEDGNLDQALDITNCEQISQLTQPNEIEAAILADLTAGRPINIQSEEFKESLDTLSNKAEPEIPANETTDIKLARDLLTSVNATDKPDRSSGLQEDINLFFALERSLLTNLQQTELDLQKLAVFLAGRFAAKEAIMKAHHSRRLTYHDIVILAQPPNEHGSRPPLGYVLDDKEAREVKFSISHHKEYATATAIVSNSGEGDRGLKTRLRHKKDKEREEGFKVRKVRIDKGSNVRMVGHDAKEREEEAGTEKEDEKKGIEGLKTRYVGSKPDQVPPFLW